MTRPVEDEFRELLRITAEIIRDGITPDSVRDFDQFVKDTLARVRAKWCVYGAVQVEPSKDGFYRRDQ